MRIILILLIGLSVFSCGKKGGISYPEGQEIPKFEKVFDE